MTFDRQQFLCFNSPGTTGPVAWRRYQESVRGNTLESLLVIGRSTTHLMTPSAWDVSMVLTSFGLTWSTVKLNITIKINTVKREYLLVCVAQCIKYIPWKVWKKWHLKMSTEFRKIWILLEIKCNLDITDKISYISKGCIVRARSWWVGTLLKRCNICWGLANHYTVITLKRLNIMVRHSLLVLYIYNIVFTIMYHSILHH